MTGKKKRIAVLCAAVAILLASTIIILSVYLAGIARYRNKVNALTVQNVDLALVADGTYTGECDVEQIYAKVSVTVQDHSITNIVLLEHRHGAGHGTPAEIILQQILARQNLQVDLVAGATNSSKVLQKAVETALLRGIIQ